jgi:hypothetical protein
LAPTISPFVPTTVIRRGLHRTGSAFKTLIRVHLRSRRRSAMPTKPLTVSERLTQYDLQNGRDVYLIALLVTTSK